MLTRFALPSRLVRLALAALPLALAVVAVTALSHTGVALAGACGLPGQPACGSSRPIITVKPAGSVDLTGLGDRFGQPDLTVTAVVASPPAVQFSVRNRGTRRVEDSLTAIYRTIIPCDSSTPTRTLLVRVPTGPLAAGETQTYAFVAKAGSGYPPIVAPVCGTQTLTVETDGDHALAESNEGNNSATVHLTPR